MARRRFFPALLGSGSPVTGKALSADERKVILSSYYAAIAGAGITLRGADKAKPWPVERAVTEGYERVVWVYKAVDTIASNSSRLPFRLKDGEDEVEDHPLYRVLNKQANPLETGRVFRKRLSAQVLLSKKGAFVEVTKSNAQTVKRLDLLPPGRTRIIPGDAETPILRFEVDPIGGGKPRVVEADKVKWVRDPHPIDPYSGMTPLEAAGLSIELDHFARLYNVSFMRNDGRPGGILGVKPPEKGGGDMDEEEMDRIESRFGRGPVEAGKLSVISGDLSYVDVAAKPRDMQYGQTSKNAKTEMLVAFGVPESQLGNAADRTFANASEEGYAFWTQTMSNHNDLILSAFDEDSDDDLVGYFDTSSIEVLQRAAAAKREEARAEFAAGLRSIYSYAVLAGMSDEIEETPITRALYLASGRTPIPARAEDAEALGIAPPVDSAAPDADAAAGAEDEPPADDAPPVGDEPVVEEEPAAPAAAAPAATGGTGEIDLFAENKALDPGAAPRLSVIDGGVPPHRRVVLAVERESKADDAEGDLPSSALDERLRDSTEADLADALAGLAERQVERAVARLKSPAQRKGTRHWTPEFDVDTRLGEKVLDAARIADEGRWETEAARLSGKVLDPAAVAAVEALIADLGLTEVKALPARFLKALRNAVDGAVNLVAESARRQAEIIATLVNDLDNAGRSIDEIVEALRGLVDSEASWAKGLAVHATTAALEGARDGVLTLLVEEGSADVRRQWLSRRDDKVRATHVKADGQKQDVGTPFEVGGALLRFPGDPLAPVRETANCRCRLLYTSKTSGRFVAKPTRRTG